MSASATQGGHNNMTLQHQSILIDHFNSVLINESFRSLQRQTARPLATTVFVFSFLFLTVWTYTPKGKHTTVLQPLFQDHPVELASEENFWTLWCKRR